MKLKEVVSQQIIGFGWGSTTLMQKKIRQLS